MKIKERIIRRIYSNISMRRIYSRPITNLPCNMFETSTLLPLVARKCNICNLSKWEKAIKKENLQRKILEVTKTNLTTDHTPSIAKNNKHYFDNSGDSKCIPATDIWNQPQIYRKATSRHIDQTQLNGKDRGLIKKNKLFSDHEVKNPKLKVLYPYFSCDIFSSYNTHVPEIRNTVSLKCHNENLFVQTKPIETRYSFSVLTSVKDNKVSERGNTFTLCTGSKEISKIFYTKYPRLLNEKHHRLMSTHSGNQESSPSEQKEVPEDPRNQEKQVSEAIDTITQQLKPTGPGLIAKKDADAELLLKSDYDLSTSERVMVDPKSEEPDFSNLLPQEKLLREMELAKKKEKPQKSEKKESPKPKKVVQKSVAPSSKDGGGGKKAASPAAPGTKPKRKKMSPEALAAGTSGTYIDAMFQEWQKDPSSVHKSWDVYFKGAQGGLEPGKAYQTPYGSPTLAVGAGIGSADEAKMMKQAALEMVAHYYQMYGHLHTETDPLEMRGPALGTKFVKSSDRKLPDEVKMMLDTFKMNLEDTFMPPSCTKLVQPNEKLLPLGEIIKRLHDTYCGYVGIEYTHITPTARRMWMRDQIESSKKPMSPEEKKMFWKGLFHALQFEEFLSRKWPILFRFSLEGCESLIPALRRIIDRCVAEGSTHFVLGMAHRGRLNVMANILNKELDKLFVHFRKDVDFKDHVGDVKYHLGCYITQKHEVSKKDITICILSNASHLESVNPILQGRTKAEQMKLGGDGAKKVVPILMHGDAAYAGQGVVYEQNTMCSQPAYSVDGIIHIVINNNIGFTATPDESRSSNYCSDVAKLVDAPIFHVNAEKPDDVIRSVDIATSYRNKFKNDVVVDLIGYRQYGHNEADEPAYTLPLVYQKIRARKRFPYVYGEQLVNEKVLTEKDVTDEKSAYTKKCNEAFEQSTKYDSIHPDDWNDSPLDLKDSDAKPTGVPKDTLKEIFLKSITPPKDFEIHKVLQRVLDNRKKLFEKEIIDWAMSESLTYGSLLKEGINVRITGQDSQRGTFSHRHHMIHHQKKEAHYIPLNHLSDKQGKYMPVNSPLNEYATLAYELGYSMGLADSLVLFEAQYGDFINNAQAIIDLYLCSGEAKWGHQSGLVMLLPHGLEGLGPEHSSARLERFLQLAGEEPECVPNLDGADFEFNQLKTCNWIVANCTLPANFFHIVRRQVKLPFRKPLIIMSPKSVLRHPGCRSKLDDFDEDHRFQSVLPDPAIQTPEGVQKHIICSGKVYFDLVETREKYELESSIALTRIEQLCPFPFDKVLNEIERYPQSEICWVQEEHKNQGPWTFVLERLIFLLNKTERKSISYVGRHASAVTAVATPHKHIEERKEFLAQAMVIGVKE